MMMIDNNDNDWRWWWLMMIAHDDDWWWLLMMMILIVDDDDDCWWWRWQLLMMMTMMMIIVINDDVVSLLSEIYRWYPIGRSLLSCYFDLLLSLSAVGPWSAPPLFVVCSSSVQNLLYLIPLFVYLWMSLSSLNSFFALLLIFLLLKQLLCFFIECYGVKGLIVSIVRSIPLDM